MYTYQGVLLSKVHKRDGSGAKQERIGYWYIGCGILAMVYWLWYIGYWHVDYGRCVLCLTLCMHMSTRNCDCHGQFFSSPCGVLSCVLLSVQVRYPLGGMVSDLTNNWVQWIIIILLEVVWLFVTFFLAAPNCPS